MITAADFEAEYGSTGLARAWQEQAGRVELPEGDFTLSSSLGMPASGRPQIGGSGRGRTRILLDPGIHLLDLGTDLLASLRLADLTVVGGAGVVRHSRTAANSGAVDGGIIARCSFEDYTATAFELRSPDSPRWVWSDSVFRAANDTGTVGIEHRGLSNNSEVVRCTFQRDRVHTKWLQPQDTLIRRCDFIQWNGAAANARASVWVVPFASGTNAGDGFSVVSSKFGNENLLATDYRVLVAAEEQNGWPDVSADSDAHVVGHTYSGNKVMGNDPGSDVPFIYTTTARTRAWRIGPNVFDGTPPGAILRYRTVDDTRRAAVSIADNLHKYATLTVSNDPGL